MKDQYFADLGDYGKYGLLRFLAGRGVKIGINWYLTPDDGSTDGKYTEYLSQPMKEWMVDTRLFEDLSKIYKKQKRTVRNVEAANLIPQASYYSICLSQDELSAREREINRNRWFEDSLNVLKEAELIFADPDNGISYCATVRTKNNEKYILPDEVEAYYQSGKDVVFYCHKGRRNDQAWFKVRTLLKDKLVNAQIMTVTYHKGTQRSYIFVLHPESCNRYAEWINSFLSEGWYPTFTNEGFVFRNTSEFQEMYHSKKEKEKALKDMSNAQIDLLIENCTNIQAKIYYSSFKI